MPGQTFFCIDAHTCGNPVRVVTGGGPVRPLANVYQMMEGIDCPL